MTEPLRASKLRVVTAASLFDGHDASINIIRRVLQQQGAEVIHLGHDRSVDEIVDAVVQEDAHAVAVSSYQGGHMEFFRYLKARLSERGAGSVAVYGGGGGTMTPAEIETLRVEGVARIFDAEDGRRLGLDGMIREIFDACAHAPLPFEAAEIETLEVGAPRQIGRAISWFEEAAIQDPAAGELQKRRARLEERAVERRIPVIGFTGTGGSGKSSVLDELVRRIRLDSPTASIALLLVDPSRRRSGGALLGDRIRLNAIHGGRVFVRSLATRKAHRALSEAVADAIRVVQAAGFDLVLVETAGIGQSDSEIVDRVDASVYVMTPEFGAPSQLEKIDMIELADFVVLNKFDRPGGADALRDVRKQWRRNRSAVASSAVGNIADDALPVFATVARDWRDSGMDRFHLAFAAKAVELGASALATLPRDVSRRDAEEALLPTERVRYLAEIAEAVRGYHAETADWAQAASRADGLARAQEAISGDVSIKAAASDAWSALAPEARAGIEGWDALLARYQTEDQAYTVRDVETKARNHSATMAGTAVPRVALPNLRDWGDRLRFLRNENVPGAFPFTAGVFPFRRRAEDPARMFAGEGGPEATNRRFHLLAAGQPAARLSTAFDSVTLYGCNPDRRPDIYGKIGNSGVSVCSLDDAKKLYSGFDLCDPKTSVSLTINGPAPTVLAFFLNAAIDQQVERHLVESGELEAVRARFEEETGTALPGYEGPLPEGHDGLGLGLLGIPGDFAVSGEVYEAIRADVLQRVRGTVQADILKEDQAQNTCIFSTEFSLKVMGDIQEYFVAKGVRNFYSVSISGYHMAEAGANPITQLAFTLANGFTYCEHYLARGMKVDDFAPNFSFFFSSGLDAEYSVMGRVARRIWAVGMRERYGARERSQKLKYHIQTSGRSLHAQEMSFNDIRTTLQALTALQDQCNSLHTNAFDEAVTTPTEASVRRALAIQLILQREFGPQQNENPLQGSYFSETLTDAVEEAVLAEFERLSERGGVLGAMESLYQRGRIQDESLLYESKKHSGEIPIVGVNTFLDSGATPLELATPELRRSDDAAKEAQLAALASFEARWNAEVEVALEALRRVALEGGNVFAELLETVKRASLGQISGALFDVGGRYRRSM